MKKFVAVSCILGALTTTVCAHDGRRLEIKVVDNQLVAQGYVSNGVDDGGGLVRPYYNTIHGHWAFGLPSWRGAHGRPFRRNGRGRGRPSGFHRR